MLGLTVAVLSVLVAYTACAARPCVQGTSEKSELELTLVEPYAPGGSFAYDSRVLYDFGLGSCGDLGLLATGARLRLMLGSPYYSTLCNGTVFDTIDVIEPPGGATLHASRPSVSVVAPHGVSAEPGPLVS